MLSGRSASTIAEEVSRVPGGGGHSPVQEPITDQFPQKPQIAKEGQCLRKFFRRVFHHPQLLCLTKGQEVKSGLKLQQAQQSPKGFYTSHPNNTGQGGWGRKETSPQPWCIILQNDFIGKRSFVRCQKQKVHITKVSTFFQIISWPLKSDSWPHGGYQ